MRKRIFVVANPIAKVSIEGEHYPASLKENETEDEIIILSRRQISVNERNKVKRGKMISLFRCDVCEARYNSSICSHDEFFERECLCCGSADHSFLDVRYEEEDKKMISLICSCPLASHTAIREKRLSVNNRKHWIDPYRLAKECGYQEKEVDYLFRRIQTKGCGRRMYSEDITRIQEAAYHHCEVERNMCHFTRDLTHLSFSDSDNDQESEDMMSICSSTNSSL